MAILIPNTFATRTGSIQLQEFDTNFQYLADSLNTLSASSITSSYVATAVSTAVPRGVIVMWYGTVATIPTGWVLCDGANGTPNLKDKFVVGAGNTYAPAGTGGSADAIIPSHSHTASSNTLTSITDPGHKHWVSGASWDDGNGTGSTNNTQDYGLWADAGSYNANDTNKANGRYILSATTGISAGSTTSTTVNATGVAVTNANLPPYYALAYIMKS